MRMATRGHRLSFYISEEMQEKLLKISEKLQLSILYRPARGLEVCRQ
ncbi:MAG: hypothetical protein Q8933_20830 [Bacteroidota bacterium]|nr:hypothetical protein [Bacteroidota bacterium]